MSAVNGATLAQPARRTMFHTGTRRQAEVAARVWAEERGTVLSVDTCRSTDAEGALTWRSVVRYHPWA